MVAIALAKENGYLNEEALANELAAKFYLTWGKEQVAQADLTNAYYCYLRWGATAKVKDLERQYPKLVKGFTTANMFRDSRNSLPNTSGSTSGEILDLAALMKASIYQKPKSSNSRKPFAFIGQALERYIQWNSYPWCDPLSGEKTRADELELHDSEGIVPIEVTSTPIFDDTGSVEYAIAAFQDISERKQAENTLIENVRLEQEISAQRITQEALRQRGSA